MPKKWKGTENTRKTSQWGCIHKIQLLYACLLFEKHQKFATNNKLQLKSSCQAVTKILPSISNKSVTKIIVWTTISATITIACTATYPKTTLPRGPLWRELNDAHIYFIVWRPRQNLQFISILRPMEIVISWSTFFGRCTDFIQNFLSVMHVF